MFVYPRPSNITDVLMKTHSIDFRFLRLHHGYEQYLDVIKKLGRDSSTTATFEEYCQGVDNLDKERVSCLNSQINITKQ